VVIETEIGDTNARRQIALWWRVVPAAQATLMMPTWTAVSTSKAAAGLELSTDTVGGTWSKDNHAATDSGTTAVGSLASGSAAPVNTEAITIYGLVARNGNVAAGDAYDNAFTTGPGGTSGSGANHCSGFSGYKIASGTQTTIADWFTATSTTAIATGLIAAFSVAAAGGADTVILTGTLPALTGHFSIVAAATAALAGTLPALIGSFDIETVADAQLVGTLPLLTGSFDIEAGVDVELAGQLPTLTGDLDIAASTDVELNGMLPALTGDFSISVGDVVEVGLNGTLPTLTGNIDIDTSSNVELSGALPTLTGDFTIGISPLTTVTLDGTLPALVGSFEIDSGAPPPGRPIQPLAPARPIQPSAQARLIQPMLMVTRPIQPMMGG